MARVSGRTGITSALTIAPAALAAAPLFFRLAEGPAVGAGTSWEKPSHLGTAAVLSFLDSLCSPKNYYSFLSYQDLIKRKVPHGGT